MSDDIKRWASPHAVPKPTNRSEFASPHASDYDAPLAPPLVEYPSESPADREARRRANDAFLQRGLQAADREIEAFLAELDRPFENLPGRKKRSRR